MSYTFRDGLSCCEADGQIVFLDLVRDRYFRLTGPSEAAARIVLMGQSLNASQARHLVASGILIEDDHGDGAKVSAIPPPSRSLTEQASSNQDVRFGFTTVLETAIIVWSTRRQLRSSQLAKVIAGVVSDRCRKAGIPPAGTSESDELFAHAGAEYAHARRFVPIDASCLLDSLSLIRFLSRRGLAARIVFGVTLSPFTAHCWVQTGETVLNDTLSNALAHAPIKVI